MMIAEKQKKAIALSGNCFLIFTMVLCLSACANRPSSSNRKYSLLPYGVVVGNVSENKEITVTRCINDETIIRRIINEINDGEVQPAKFILLGGTTVVVVNVAAADSLPYFAWCFPDFTIPSGGVPFSLHARGTKVFIDGVPDSWPHRHVYVSTAWEFLFESTTFESDRGIGNR